jgi:TusA-related sulfurtransferase
MSETSSSVSPDVLDARGLLCPAPVIALARRIREVEVAAEVEVWADDPAARHDIPAWCRMTGQQLVEQGDLSPDTGPGHRFVVRRMS